MENHMDHTMKRHLDLACRKLIEQEQKLTEQEMNLQHTKMEFANRMEAAEGRIQTLLVKSNLGD